MRILFVLGGLRRGGYEILSVQIANALAEKGNRVAFISLSDDSDIKKRMSQCIDLYTIKRYFKYDPSLVPRVSLALRRFQPDIILCCAFYPYFVSRFASLLVHGRWNFILAFHATEPFNSVEDRWNLVYALCARLFRDYYIAIHNTQVGFYSDRYGLPRNRFTVIHNGIDTDHYSRRHKPKQNEVFRIAHVANLKPLKDQLTLLKSVAELTKYSNDWELIIAGSGASGILNEYEDFVVQHGIADNVKFVGAVPDSRDILNTADVFVLTSLTEALPLSVIEAMSMGLPCIVTNVGGNSDIVEHDREGFLVTPRDYVTIAKHLKLLLEDGSKRQRMSVSARKKAISEFGFEQMIERYIELFDSIIGN
jgi:glycosyltransferase involved in cell wall biosynthesis